MLPTNTLFAFFHVSRPVRAMPTLCEGGLHHPIFHSLTHVWLHGQKGGFDQVRVRGVFKRPSVVLLKHSGKGLCQSSPRLDKPVFLERMPFQELNIQSLPRKVGPGDFERVKLIGQGDVGKVYLVRLKSTRSLFAMKVLSKTEMIARNKVNGTQPRRCNLSSVHAVDFRRS